MPIGRPTGVGSNAVRKDSPCQESLGAFIVRADLSPEAEVFC